MREVKDSLIYWWTIRLTFFQSKYFPKVAQIAGLKVRHLKWSDFKGQVDESMPWSAHIYWWIEYQITDYKKKKISVKLHINPKSWVRPEKKCDHLLNH